ncbi:hypothetical protein [Frankia sp. AgKG'84/4]|uniref:hypothetical protein n=1 Tax=Frankia sp. AgKG'84/4 TaxID=573490 RepID=UPI0020101076|nr:hypothetical protein [Frankia sp. AgKG'84/4]MCL9794536.1 hypothetical protein [Frankia sp. AgKG'84/4]
MSADTLLVDVAWPELPRQLTGPEELADQLGAGLRDRAGIATVDENGLAVLVRRPADVEAFAADLADQLSMIGMPDRTYLSWRDELGVHRRSVTGRRIANAHRPVA